MKESTQKVLLVIYIVACLIGGAFIIRSSEMAREDGPIMTGATEIFAPIWVPLWGVGAVVTIGL